MSHKTKTIVFSVIICLVLLTLTGCGENIAAITTANKYVVGKDNAGNEITVADLTKDIIKNASWKATQTGNNWEITLQGKIKTKKSIEKLIKTGPLSHYTKQKFTIVFTVTKNKVQPTEGRYLLDSFCTYYNVLDELKSKK